MTIHAYTETANYKTYPAYINVSENRFVPGQVLVTVRNREFTAPSVIGLDREQLQALADAINAYLGTSHDIKRAVDRFLGWKLPADFYPDAGISFDRSYAEKWGMPSGTNLFHAGQAQAMFEYALKVTK